MLRSSFAALLILSLPAVASAQLAPGIAAPGGGAPGLAASSGGMVAGWRMPGPLPVTPGPAKYPCGGNFGGGFTPAAPIVPINRPGYPFSGVWGLGGGSFYPNYPVYPGFGGGYVGYGFGPSYNFDLYNQPVVDLQPAPATVLPPTGNIALVNEFPATLTLEFPAPAEVWVDGVKGEGRPTTEWTLTSPVLRMGKEYTFKVKARWTLNGKTYEYQRAVDVAGGNRSRAQVVAGVEVKE